MYRLFLKRLLDILFSGMFLLLASPILFLLIVALCFGNKHSGVFFLQSRPGKKEKIFKVIKFKTMSDEKDAEGNLLPNINRITPIGAFLRKYSMDELPQMFNVLKGDMSLIGPRPLMIHYLPLYSKEQLRRHDVRPGITGWAQINGRNSISWTRKFELDVYYVDNISFALDMKIFFRTIKKIIMKEGVNSSENITMTPFNGNN